MGTYLSDNVRDEPPRLPFLRLLSLRISINYYNFPYIDAKISGTSLDPLQLLRYSTKGNAWLLTCDPMITGTRPLTALCQFRQDSRGGFTISPEFWTTKSLLESHWVGIPWPLLSKRSLTGRMSS
jgi:hypothetical protein